MDRYSILAKKHAQAVPQTTSPVPASWSPAMTSGGSAGMARETLRFPGEDGGKSLGEMAQRDLDATLQLLAERAQYITGASGAAIALREGEDMICCASAGAAAPELGAPLQIDSGLSAESVRTRKTLHCDDAENDPRVNRESCRAFGIKSVAVMPLLRGEEVYGVFELLAGRPRAFEERDYIALQRLSEMIQTAVEHAEAARRAEALGTVATVDTGTEATTSAPLSVTGTSSTTPGQPAPKNKAANQNPTLELAGRPVATEVDTGNVEGKTEQGFGPVAPIAFGKVGNCAGCGFPISEGRRLCLDCEAATPNVNLAGDAAQPFAGLFESRPSWLRSHVYLVATLLLVVATIAVVVWRL